METVPDIQLLTHRLVLLEKKRDHLTLWSMREEFEHRLSLRVALEYPVFPEEMDPARWPGGAQDRIGTWGSFYVLLRPVRLVIGSCGFHGPPGPEHSVSIGYSIVPAFRRKGYAIEVVKALTHLARENGALTVEADTLENDPASGGVLRKCGFAPIGEPYIFQDIDLGELCCRHWSRPTD